MEKKIEAYIHLYLGCGATEGNDALVGKLSGIHLNHCYIDYDYKIQSVSIDNLKLVLRPLSDMTEEELKHFGVSETLTKEELQQHFFDCPFFTPDEYVYLLKHGFDLFGLIEDGLAVDKTKMK